MTDLRIEAVARVLFGSVVDSEDWNAYLLRKAQEAISAADDAAWRPIDTAPLDGTYVDLWVIDEDGKGRRFADSHFGPIPHTCGEYGQYCDSCPEEGNFWIDGIFGHEIHGEITHWMPLPKPKKGG